jgi:hypothetical protein
VISTTCPWVNHIRSPHGAFPRIDAHHCNCHMSLLALVLKEFGEGAQSLVTQSGGQVVEKESLWDHSQTGTVIRILAPGR